MKKHLLRRIILFFLLLFVNQLYSFGLGTDVIYFADDNVKEICVANWDTNGDGELSKNEAATITDLGRAFERKSIKSFNELQYFTGLTKIGDHAFEYCKSLVSITIPNNVTSIGGWAFGDCTSLTSATIPNSVTTIGNSAFYRCNNLFSVTIPNSVTYVGGQAFYGTGWYSNQSNGVLYLDNWLLGYKGYKIYVRDIIIVEGTKGIAEKAFYHCSDITSILTPNSLIFIGDHAFDGCSSLTSVIIGNNVTFIGEAIFSCCDNLSSIVIKTGNTAYDSRENCNAIIETASNTLIAGCKNTIIPNSVTSIGKTAFYTQTNLTSITIPSSVTTIGKWAFYGCIQLKEVTSKIYNPFEIDEFVFFGILSNAILTVPKGTYNSYESFIGWTKYFKEVKEDSDIDFHSLTITASGNGSITYNSTTIKNQTKSFTVEEGTTATITLSPENGYRIKSIKNNSTNVTSSVNNSKYTISNITADISLEVEFEAIPTTTYILSVKATGSGYAYYNSTIIRNTTKTFSINEGASATINVTPDDGYKIKSVKKDGTDVTSNVSNNKYNVSNIQSNTSVEVEFEAITHTLSIKASGNGVATYDGTSIRNKTTTFSVIEGSSATVKFTPDNGYQIKSAKVNSTNVTYSVSNSHYTISNITADTTLEVEFEAIPPTTYTLSIKSTGNGSASYNSTTIRNTTKTFTVNEGTSATISFTPDNGYHIKSVKVNNTGLVNVESQLTINNIMENTMVEVEFEANPTLFACEGINYSVTSYDNKTVRLAKGNYGKVLEVPSTISYMDTEWTVTGVDEDAFDNAEELAAIIWHPVVSFNATISNPNLLLYVYKSSYAPASIKNVVVNGTATNITLTDAESGNNFYCPQEFTAQHISYSHNYKMTTGIGVAKGWETIVLPFDVQTVMHEEKGEIAPFAKWQSGDATKPFWLMRLEDSGWEAADGIKANTPYIISMPNNNEYKDEFLLSGRVSFSAENVTVRKIENMQTSSYKGRTFVPTYTEQAMGSGLYVLNVDNDYETNVSGVDDGSHFVLNLRKVHPFEAYMVTSTNGSRAIDISDGMDDGIDEEEQMSMRVYNLKGLMMKTKEGKSMEEIKQTLPSGVYIVNGHKMIVK